MADILFDKSDGILRITLNRPAKKNAMTGDMYKSMADALWEAGRDEAVRVVLWQGAGDAFCAGNDIGDFLHNPPAPADNPQRWLMNALIEFDKPIVAAVREKARVSARP